MSLEEVSGREKEMEREPDKRETKDLFREQAMKDDDREDPINKNGSNVHFSREVEEAQRITPEKTSILPTFKTACKEAGWIFVLSRVVIIILTYLGTSLLPMNQNQHSFNCTVNAKACVISWMHYDVFSYMDIAMHGYVNVKATAFFPLFPLLLRLPGGWLGGSVVDYYIAGIIISNIFFFFALIVLYMLVENRFDTSIARTALFYTAFAPYALFFFIGYTEALFLLLSVLTFFFLDRAIQKHSILSWWLAGCCGFLAALSRSQGVLLIVPYFVLCMQQFFLPRAFSESAWREKLLAFVPIVLIPLGLGTYMLYLWKAQGNPFMFSVAERMDWGRLSLTFPLVTISYVVKALFVPASVQIFNLINLVSLCVPIMGLLIGWKRIPLHYSLFALCLIVFVTLYPEGTHDALTSVPRYLTIVFPTTIIFASIKNFRFEKAYLALTLSMFTLNLLLFISHYWVA